MPIEGARLESVYTAMSRIEGSNPFPSCEVHLETTGGQLARSRLSLDAGKGSFAVSASGLEPGERFKIKAGFRHYSGVAEHWFEVTA